MIKDIAYPESIKGKELDDYLSRGWYRLGSAVFTTDYIPAFELHPDKFKIPVETELTGDIDDSAELTLDFNKFFYRVYWLRFRLNDFVFEKTHQKLIKKNSLFEFSITPFKNNKELEGLYQVYKASIDFEISPTLAESLMGPFTNREESNKIFDTWIVRLRYGKKLIAAGIFDKGQRSLAGIVNFFDPEFSKFSPGKFLMLQKIKYALENNYCFYYPGYISPDYRKFDYKLFPGSRFAEIMDPDSGQWQALPDGE